MNALILEGMIKADQVLGLYQARLCHGFGLLRGRTYPVNTAPIR